MSEVSNMNSDFGYYNIILNNFTDNSYQLAEFTDNRNQPILNNMNDWQVSVNRFKIPSVSIPLLIFADNRLDPTDPLYDSPYKLALSIGANDANLTNTEIVKYVPSTPQAGFPFNTYPYNRFVYYYKQFLDMVNTALSNLWYASAANPPYDTLIDITQPPPYFVLDNTTPYIKVVLPADGNGSPNPPSPFYPANPNGINILMSSKLFYFFTGFPAFFYGAAGLAGNNEINYKLLFTMSQLNVQTLPPFGITNVNNPYTGAARTVSIVYQDYSSLELWQTLSRIIITTTIPIESEAITVKDANGQPYSLNVLTDFEIPALDTGAQRQYLYYNAIYPRFLNLKSPGFLRKLDAKIFVQFRDLETIQLVIPPTFECYIKLQFVRRKAYNMLQYTKKDLKLSDYR